MVFLNKNREKALSGGKKKTASAAAPAQEAQTIQQKQAPIQFSVKQPVGADKLPPALQLQAPSITANQRVASAPVSAPLTPSAPWWVSDVTFIVEGKKIPGHKVVLQSRSGYFSQLFHTSSAQEVTLEVTEFSHHIFSQFVRWVYGGKKEISPEDAPDLAKCAIHFQAPELLSLCQKIIEETPKQAPAPAPTQQQPQPQPMAMDEEEAVAVVAAPPSPLPHHHQQALPHPHSHQAAVYDTHNDPVISGLAHPSNNEAMIELLESPLMNDHQQDFVSADQSYQDFGFGMNVWSNDPVLYHPSEQNDAFRIMEIC